MGEPVSVVMITSNRRDAVVATLARLTTLPEQPTIIVVDNGSSDGTPAAVRERFPDVAVHALERNLGAAGRDVGVRLATTPYVAFADDDSWWAPGALARAVRRFAERPRLGLLAARVLVGPEAADDPVNDRLAAGPVLGFLACGAVVRREAFLQAGGFHPAYGVGGEEHLFALDLAAAGWQLDYAPDVVAHHHPGGAPARPGRRARQLRNDLWSAWLRHPADLAVRHTGAALRRALTDPAAARGLWQALRGLPWVVRQRRAVPPRVAADLRRVIGPAG